MISFWLWLALIGISWGLALTQLHMNIFDMPFHIIGSALFFALFFLSPLFKNNKYISTINFIFMSLIAFFIFLPDQNATEINSFSLLVFTILAGKAAFRLPWKNTVVIWLLIYILNILPPLMGLTSYSIIFQTIYAILLALGLTGYKRLLEVERDARARSEALLHEHRKLKRQLVHDEKMARQDERTQIARDIHDSVGHKLTALLMQLEVFRMQADSESQDKILELKGLAKDSLEETRRAVKAMKRDETKGLAAIIELIKKLESESAVRVHFTIKHGALSVPLNNEQSVAIYRAVQEGITNMMRHSGSREINILFEAPGSAVFRFELVNPIRGENDHFQEGFGLRSMRERLEQAGGTLDIKQYNGKFVVRGSLPLSLKEENSHD